MEVWFMFGCVCFLCVLFVTECTVTRCTFPAHIWRPLANDTARVWTTRINIVERLHDWDTLIEVTATQHTLEAKERFKAHCDDYGTGSVPCDQKHRKWERSCLQDHGDGRYQVMHQGNGRTVYMCLKIVKLHKNILQIWEGSEHTENNEEICSDSLGRDPWPWIDVNSDTWSFCPIVGGFDFRSYPYQRKKHMCNNFWRSSRMESECVQGEGLKFTFPDTACSPFPGSENRYEMQCVGHWEESNYLFIVGRKPGHIPQYILRVDKDYASREQFSSVLYFCPVSTTRHDKKLDGVGPGYNVFYVELRMTRSESGLCFDESADCDVHKQRHRCSDLSNYGNYCKRTCGFCGLVISQRSECRFPLEYLGDLHLFTNTRHDKLHIHAGYLEFSNLGEFVCKKKHWELNQYKLLSFYSNGCRPRYTCIEFGQITGSSLEYRISRSDLQDRGFDICRFSDDAAPLNDDIRSYAMKTLIPSTVIRGEYCGIGGVMRVTVTLTGGRQCTGVLSDWDTDQCHTTDRLHVAFTNCHHNHHHQQHLTGGGGAAANNRSRSQILHAENNNQIYTEYECISYIPTEADRSFLITRPVDAPERYQCWVIETYPARMSLRPWRVGTLLDTAQCPSPSDAPHTYSSHAELTVARRQNDAIPTPCPRMDSTHTDLHDQHHRTVNPARRPSGGREADQRDDTLSRDPAYKDLVQNSSADLYHLDIAALFFYSCVTLLKTVCCHAV